MQMPMYEISFKEASSSTRYRIPESMEQKKYDNMHAYIKHLEKSTGM